jgi:hypothetical protein
MRQPFWVRLYASHAVTKKSQNSRMGKGKGSGAGSRGQIKAGSCVLRLYGWRKGLVRQVRRSVGVRFSIPLWVRLCSGLSGVRWGKGPARALTQRRRVGGLLNRAIRRWLGSRRRLRYQLIRRATMVRLKGFFISPGLRKAGRGKGLGLWERALRPSALAQAAVSLEPKSLWVD